ncbi:hypothetical protein T492DRAFT_835356 [Pavlovales sp. CCMP2436]|nr:hypothetical protein T492DRAFT_835356 [Pavlovales sp. CCMP2436]
MTPPLPPPLSLPPLLSPHCSEEAGGARVGGVPRAARGLHAGGKAFVAIECCAQVTSALNVTAALNVSRIAVGHTPANNVRISMIQKEEEKEEKSCGGALLALDSALARWFRTAGNHYCHGEEEGHSSRGQVVCPLKAASCDGQVTHFTRAGAAHGGWQVAVVASDDSDGAQAARWSRPADGAAGGVAPPDEL